MATTIGDFIEQAWNDHVDDLAGVTARLDRALPMLKREPARVGDFVALAEHVLLSHQGDADAMAHWLDRLAPLALEHPESGPSLARARLAVGLLRGQSIDARGHTRPVLIRAHGNAANGAAARGDIVQARELLQAAAAFVTDERDADAVKALAAIANNLASQLRDGPRGGDADRLMMEAAEMAQRRWHQAGTWLQAERADYLLAVCAAAIGDGARALRHAAACQSLCTAHGADAFEHFFAQEALGRASLAAGHRTGAADALAHMRELLPQIDDDGNRAYAQSVLDKVQATLGAA